MTVCPGLISVILIDRQAICIIIPAIIYPSQRTDGIDGQANYCFVNLAATGNQIIS